MVWEILSKQRVDLRGYRRTMALVRCSCGYETTIRYDSIGKGSSACYRCANISHGDSHTRFYSIWKNMIHRCHNPKSDNYLRYGALGINVLS